MDKTNRLEVGLDSGVGNYNGRVNTIRHLALRILVLEMGQLV